VRIFSLFAKRQDQHGNMIKGVISKQNLAVRNKRITIKYINLDQMNLKQFICKDHVQVGLGSVDTQLKQLHIHPGVL
jgi:hypothetical protein